MYEYGFAISRSGINSMVDLVVTFQEWIDSKYTPRELADNSPLQVVLMMSANSTDIVLQDEIVWSSNYDYDEDLSLSLLKKNFINSCKEYVRFIENSSEEYSKFLKEE